MTMGLIEKSIRKRSNQKLAAEVFTQTALSFDEVVVGVRKYCTAENEKVSRLLEESREKAKTRLGKWTASLADPKNSHYYVWVRLLEGYLIPVFRSYLECPG
jgi:hypothetical protein